MVSHEGQSEGTGKGDGRRERSYKEIDHGDGESSEDQWDDPKVSFWFVEWIELVSEDKEERRMKEGGIFFIEFYLAFEVVSRVIKCMNFIRPEGFLVKCVKS